MGRKAMARALILTLVLSSAAAMPLYARVVTYEEVLKALSKLVPLVTGYDINTSEDVYLHPAVDIYPLWEKLGIKDSLLSRPKVLFGCDPGAEQCFISTSKVDTLMAGPLKVIHLTDQKAWDHQYFFFRKEEKDGVSRMVFLKNFECADQLLGAPKITSLDETLFSFTQLAAYGGNAVLHEVTLYQYADDSLREILRYPLFYKGIEKDGFFNVVIRSSYELDFDVFILTYHILVKMSSSPYYSEVKASLPKEPIIQTEKKIIYDREAQGFFRDEVNSSTTIDQINMLCDANRDDYYAVFTADFDALEGRDPKTQEWLDKFKERLSGKK